MLTLPIPVDDSTAEAYRAAPADEQQRIAALVGAFVRASLRPDPDPTAALRHAADAAGAEARANGWTDHLDAALLRGDLDDG